MVLFIVCGFLSVVWLLFFEEENYINFYPLKLFLGVVYKSSSTPQVGCGRNEDVNIDEWSHQAGQNRELNN